MLIDNIEVISFLNLNIKQQMKAKLNYLILGFYIIAYIVLILYMMEKSTN